MVRFTSLRKHLGKIPPNIFIANISASAWDRIQQGHLRYMTTHQLRRPAQPVLAAPFGYWRLPLLPPPTNENRHPKPAPWHTPSRRSKDFTNSEGEDQGGAIPSSDPAAFFEDQRLPIPPPTTSGNRHHKPAPWLTPAQIRDDFQKNEGEEQEGKNPADDHRRDLQFRVRNISSDTCPPQACHVINQNVQGLMGGDKLENTLEVMIKKCIHG